MPQLAVLPYALKVFAIDLASVTQANSLFQAFISTFLNLKPALTLADCDRVLRLCSCKGTAPTCWQQVLIFVRGLGVRIELLPD